MIECRHFWRVAVIISEINYRFLQHPEVLSHAADADGWEQRRKLMPGMTQHRSQLSGKKIEHKKLRLNFTFSSLDVATLSVT